MPKVEKTRHRPHAADDDVLEEAGPTAMAVTEQMAADEPVKPSFAPLSAQEQSGKRLEFRRVRTGRPLFSLCPAHDDFAYHLELIPGQSAAAWPEPGFYLHLPTDKTS